MELSSSSLPVRTPLYALSQLSNERTLGRVMSSNPVMPPNDSNRRMKSMFCR